MINLVIFDYDGTVADIRDGAPDFDRAFVRALADFVGESDIRQEWERLKVTIRSESPERAWSVVGTDGIAPAAADPYTLASEAAKLFLEQKGLATSPALRGLIAGELYKVAYAQAPYSFRPDARVVLGVLMKARLGDRPIRTCFVTNASTETVRQRLTNRLFPEGLDPISVHGGASKFRLGPPAAPDSRFDSLPESVRLPELERPVFLKRGAYFDVLKELWADPSHPAVPETTLVVGDIWELDLALPAALGTHTHFILRDNTYDYELAAARDCGRCQVSAQLFPVLQRIFE